MSPRAYGSIALPAPYEPAKLRPCLGPHCDGHLILSTRAERLCARAKADVARLDWGAPDDVVTPVPRYRVEA